MAHVIKVVKGDFLGTPYWSGKMPVGSVRRIRRPSDKFWDDIFDPVERAQRDLNKARISRDMVPYLLNKTKHPFFSALALILVPVEGGELREGVDFNFRPIEGFDDVGVLTIEDSVEFFVADGQHRREAIEKAYDEDRTIHSQDVPVILLPFDGADRVRQLFADLNLHAKNPGKTIGLAYDYRDPIAVLAKRLMQDVALFDNGRRVNTKTNSLSAKSPAVISLNTLVEGTRQILAALLDTPINKVGEHQDLKAIEALEPGDAKVGAVARRVADVFETIIGAFPQWDDVREGRREPGELRDGVKDEDGKIVEQGYVFAFGLGWQALALIAAAVIRVEGDDWSGALPRVIRSVDWQKGKHWNGIAMIYPAGSDEGRVNNTAPGVKATAGYVLAKGGLGEADDPDVQGLVRAYEGPREAVPTAAE
jgi:DGQHR domain-containing protein